MLIPTAAVAVSLMIWIFSLCRVSTKSHGAPIALMMIAATGTKAVTDQDQQEVDPGPQEAGGGEHECRQDQLISDREVADHCVAKTV